MKLKHLGSLLLIAITFGFSCTAYKQVPYFQDLRRDTIVNEKINNYSPFTLEPGDLLGLVVTSLNRDADLPYNYNLVPLPQSGLGDQASPLPGVQGTEVSGYLVDQDGNIKLPNVGKVNVMGLTTKEVQALLESKLEVYLSKPVVNVRILNFKISVLGDVKTPGSFAIKNEKVSLIEALSMAGDLNITGMRQNVVLIREKDGTRQYVTVDLTSKKLFTSPYFYLKNNDVLYVQPNKAKAFADEVITTKISLIISGVTLLILALKK